MPPAVSSVHMMDHHHHHHHSDDRHHHDPHRDSPPPSPVGSCGSIRQTHTHLTYSRLHLQGIARETIKIAENGEYTNHKGETVYLKGALDSAVENCVHYEHEFDFHAALELHDMDLGGGGGGSGRSLLGSLEEGGAGTSAPSPSPVTGGGKNRRGGRRGASSGVAGNSSSSGGGGGTLSSSLHTPDTLKLSFAGLPGVGGGRESRFPRTSFLVVSASWLESASELLKATATINDIRVGVLNSASGTTPGGRFLKGTVSQEDCLCRASLLYSCISQPKFQSDSRFYGKNRSLKYGSSNCVIFSPDVPVIREDNVEGKLLDSYEKVSFVTIPAPNAFTTSSNTGKEYNDVESEQRQKKLDARRNLSSFDLAAMSPMEAADADADEKFEKKRRALLSSLSDRIHRALSAFVLGGCTDLVLPAFGCGVHGNDPTMVAGVFREMLTNRDMFGGRFRTVVFAIPPSRKHNYQAFAAYFQQKESVERELQMRRYSSMD